VVRIHNPTRALLRAPFLLQARTPQLLAGQKVAATCGPLTCIFIPSILQPYRSGGWIAAEDRSGRLFRPHLRRGNQPDRPRDRTPFRGPTRTRNGIAFCGAIIYAHDEKQSSDARLTDGNSRGHDALDRPTLIDKIGCCWAYGTLGMWPATQFKFDICLWLTPCAANRTVTAFCRRQKRGIRFGVPGCVSRCLEICPRLCRYMRRYVSSLASLSAKVANARRRG
jgi:hypothetical protein